MTVSYQMKLSNITIQCTKMWRTGLCCFVIDVIALFPLHKRLLHF